MRENKQLTKKRIYEIIEKADEGDRASRIFDYSILTLIVLTVVEVILESFDGLIGQYQLYFSAFEIITVLIFTVEYLLRLWTADLKFPSKKAWEARITYLFTFMAIVDLLAILPFYLPFFIVVDLRFLRLVRLTRLFRIFKVNRYSSSFRLIRKVMVKAKDELITTVFLMFFIMLMSAILMYNAEHDVQPEAFPNIVATFWWAVATLTTVGYGDVYPVTATGKLLASVIAISGIGIVALPTGIISSEFMSEISKRDQERTICPHCGKKLE